VIEPCATPNPDALKFPVGFPIASGFNVRAGEDASANPFAAAVFAAGGVAAVFAVNDFVTVTRQPGADWEPIVAAVRAAVADGLLPAGADEDAAARLATARDALQSALRDAAADERDRAGEVQLRGRRPRPE
jgi:hypothetical protein